MTKLTKAQILVSNATKGKACAEKIEQLKMWQDGLDQCMTDIAECCDIDIMAIMRNGAPYKYMYISDSVVAGVFDSLVELFDNLIDNAGDLV